MAWSWANWAFVVSTSWALAQPFLASGSVAVQVGLGIDYLSLIAVAIGDGLVELRLVRTRIDLGEDDRPSSPSALA